MAENKSLEVQSTKQRIVKWDDLHTKGFPTTKRQSLVFGLPGEMGIYQFPTSGLMTIPDFMGIVGV